jgi:hypothetical protein
MMRAFGAAPIVVAAVAGLAATPAQAENWVSLLRGENGSELMIDSESVQTGAIASAWVMINYAQPQRGAHYAAYRWQVKCANETIRIRNAVRFDAQDVPVWSYDRDDQEYMRAEPGTFFARVIRFICDV